MERLDKKGPVVKLTEAQKKKLAELDARYQAKIAEREIGLRNEMGKASAANDWESVEKLEKQLVDERKKIQSELEEKKEQVRQRGK